MNKLTIATTARGDVADIANDRPALLQRLKQQHGLKLDWQPRGALGQGEWFGQPVEGEPDLAGARALIEMTLAPASDSEIVDALALMSVKVVRRETDIDAAELQLAAYANELRAYPRDVVLKVLAEWPCQSAWWPAWFDLKKRCDTLSRDRQLMLDAIDAYKPPEPPRLRPAPASATTPTTTNPQRDIAARRAALDALSQSRGGAEREGAS